MKLIQGVIRLNVRGMTSLHLGRSSTTLEAKSVCLSDCLTIRLFDCLTVCQHLTVRLFNCLSDHLTM